MHVCVYVHTCVCVCVYVHTCVFVYMLDTSWLVKYFFKKLVVFVNSFLNKGMASFLTVCMCVCVVHSARLRADGSFCVSC